MATRKKLAAAGELGRRGGQKRVKKGFAMMKPEELAATAEKAVAARKMTPKEPSAVTKKSRILWITVYGLMLLAFAWEAGFQFNASPSTVNRTLAGALSVGGFAFCIKMVWKELTERRGQGSDEA